MSMTEFEEIVNYLVVRSTLDDYFLKFRKLMQTANYFDIDCELFTNINLKTTVLWLSKSTYLVSYNTTVNFKII